MFIGNKFSFAVNEKFCFLQICKFLSDHRKSFSHGIIAEIYFPSLTSFGVANLSAIEIVDLTFLRPQNVYNKQLPFQKDNNNLHNSYCWHYYISVHL